MLDLIPKSRDPRLAEHAQRFGLPAGGDGMGEGADVGDFGSVDDDGFGGVDDDGFGGGSSVSGYFTDRVGFWHGGGGGGFGHGRGRFGPAGGWWGGGWWPHRFWEREYYPWFEAGPWLWGSMPWDVYESFPCPDFPWLGYCPPLGAFDWRAFEYGDGYGGY